MQKTFQMLQQIVYNMTIRRLFMVRIWAKTTQDDKVLKSIIYEKDEHFTHEHFQTYLEEISTILDIPTPIYLSKHIKHYINFNNTVFTQDDFVESIDFEKLVLEEASKY